MPWATQAPWPAALLALLAVQDRPGSSQERTKSPQERPKTASRSQRKDPRSPKSGPRAPKSGPRPPQEVPRATQETLVEKLPHPTSAGLSKALPQEDPPRPAGEVGETKSDPGEAQISKIVVFHLFFNVF